MEYKINEFIDDIIQKYLDEYFTPKKEDSCSGVSKESNSNIYIGEDKENKELTLLFAFPGFNKEDIDITTMGNLLKVTGEREKTQRSNEINIYHFNKDITYKVRLCDEYINGEYSCVFENGELKVVIKAKDNSRVITID